MDTQSYVWIDPKSRPGPADGLVINSVIDSQMGASLKEPTVVTINNNSGKDWKGTVRLTLEQGLTAEKPEGIPISVAKGATESVTLNIIKSPDLNAGRFGELAAEILVCNANGRIIDWSRKWFKVGCPVELVMAIPTSFDEANR
jgi:hypothetical protein